MQPARVPIVDVGPGLGLGLDADQCGSLEALTAAVNDLCARAEDRRTPTAVVVRFGSVEPTTSWPGRIGIRDVTRWERATRRLERLHAATIAVAGPSCGGPALDLLLATDYRIAAADSTLILPVVDGHFWPGMVTHRLVRQVGLAQARRLVLWGNTVTADQASALGLVDEVAADLDAAAHAAVVMLGRIAGPELSVRRQLLNEATSSVYDDAIGAHLAACDRELRRIGAAAPDRPGVAGGS
ncbi:enoyl-CoA-hydratase DpgB [Dactylosporangium matsuzakiense]|uniref:(3,5-dihydroxycyclohex-3-enyl)acetyl-CoA dehydratase subunit B n=1 Tax=Dactylosporangium matsuzakiense TaxID=53360 RepID=A0A9W6KQM1_9ACTN|nr:enoyl-CoA-hydratase DpgB [Dactylosporangium matsuzakiense]GLL03744.1 hypothetical protein GCM10017581_054900 [Dactylosporangium matsuzakiense]